MRLASLLAAFALIVPCATAMTREPGTSLAHDPRACDAAVAGWSEPRAPIVRDAAAELERALSTSSAEPAPNRNAIAPAAPTPGDTNPPPPPGQRCTKCKDLGRKPCPQHPAADCESELDVLYCSEIAECPVCGGVGWIDCPDCDIPEMLTWLEARRTKIKAKHTALQSIDQSMKRPLRKGESMHAILVWEIDELKVDKRRLGHHELLHLYLRRLETLYTDFITRLAVDDKKFGKKAEVYVWGLPADNIACGAARCEQSARGGVKLLGGTPRYTVCGNKQFFLGDEELHRNLVHSISHLWLSNVSPAGWMGNIKGGWLDEGLSHWFEDKYWGICTNYCYQEANTNVDFKGGKFRLAVRKMVAENTQPPVAEVIQQNSDTLTLPMHAVSMSYVDYLLNQDGTKFYELTKKLKAKVPAGDALQQTYGMRPLEFEASWKAFVLATYPTK